MLWVTQNLFRMAMSDWKFGCPGTDNRRLSNPLLSIADGNSKRPLMYRSRKRILLTARTITDSLTPLPEQFFSGWQDDFFGCSIQVLFWQNPSGPQAVPSLTRTECMGLEMLLSNESEWDVVFLLLWIRFIHLLALVRTVPCIDTEDHEVRWGHAWVREPTFTMQ